MFELHEICVFILLILDALLTTGIMLDRLSGFKPVAFQMRLTGDSSFFS
jgi:hypothetical protein